MQAPATPRTFAAAYRRAGLCAAILTAALAAGCATTGEEIPALQSAQAAVQDARSTPRIEEFGRRSLQEAERNLQRAQSLAEEGGDRDAIEHYAFLAQRQVEIARSRLNRGLVQEEINTADQRRQELMLAQQQRRSERERARASAARQRAEEAEAQLALTQRELERTQQAAQSLAAELDELKVQQDERGTVLTLSDVVFDVNSDKLKGGGERTLARVADTLKQQSNTRILVEGHTDATGSEEYNRDLSKRRAESVKAELVKAGIPEERIQIEGYGEDYPVASNDSAQGRQMNRRVEIVVSGDDQPVSRRDS